MCQLTRTCLFGSMPWLISGVFSVATVSLARLAIIAELIESLTYNGWHGLVRASLALNGESRMTRFDLTGEE
jgi:hypothetical protein